MKFTGAGPFLAPSEPVTTNASSTGRDRRVDHRLSPVELSTPASIRIPNHPSVTLVDLSPGGALIELPFQIRPNSRITVEFRAASESILLPFQLLRCYVTSVQGGIRYQAAGAFEERLEWKPLLAGTAAVTMANRLTATLEAFLRHGSTTGRVIEFDNLLMWILEAARRGERGDRIAVEIRLRLGRMIPSVTIKCATQPTLPDPVKGARFFGFDFHCDRALTTPDRRLLRASAQLLSIINGTADASQAALPLDFKRRQMTEAPTIAYTIAEWQDMCNTRDPIPHLDPWLRTA